MATSRPQLVSRALRYSFVVALALGGVLLFLLASASSNTQAFARYYPLLLAINGVVAVVLFGFVVGLVIRLARRWRARRFGARLMTRFALAFTLMGVLPGVLIYVVSVQFLSRSIESWFDVRVDRALESGLSLGRAALEAQLADMAAKARTIALELADAPESRQLAVLDRERERAGIGEALLISAGGQLIGTTGGAPTEFTPDLPSAANLRQARMQRGFAAIEGDPLATEPRAGLRTRVIVPIPAAAPSAAPATQFGFAGRTDARLSEPTRSLLASPGEQRFLQLIQRVPSSVASNAEALQSGYRDYQELSLARGGLQRIYALTLTLTLLLAMLAAMAGGVLLASSMTAPLLQVAEGTKAVAEGDFRPVREFPGNDELNLLTQSFNAMTRQLSEARDAVDARSRELENARAFLERVLANLSAGVIVLDQEFRLVTANFGASRILGTAFNEHAGERLADVAPAIAAPVATAFADQALAAAPNESWQRQIEVVLDEAAGTKLTLLARGSRLPLDDGPGHVVVFDDITQVISAQRAVAWGEVARRLAHEIKNPLTPIQLTAERLQMKLADRLPPEQASVLVRGAATIVNQVAAMKRMVDDFRQYAREPPAQLAALDLNALVEEIAGLYGAEGKRIALGATTIELDLARDLPQIDGDATQLRQVIHNLIGNAHEALLHLAVVPAGGGHITVRTAIVPVREPGAQPAVAVRLVVEDNGPGFAANILTRAFEPYVTTKPGGTGLGLAMVKKIVDEHGARVELVNRPGGGASVIIVFRRLAAAAAPDPQRRVA